ncbi:ANTAR domain-containing protein [Labedella phragmitis]|uniref:ANTAR domain-containing protein n=1 Tax=Labedella phragmitis TaxID=2498849 RepID=A0A444PWY8_9MICO|nr:GAF and ANTAR domain-containing protein [Labedella phragmitis]RWZ52409.1 ANTAR domain-containing protein [Labedella phragmitis]
MSEARFAAALAALSQPHDGSGSLTEPILDVIPVTGASVSTLGDLFGSETVEASDAVIGRIDELQFDLGEGPCWDAISVGEPVLEPDLSTPIRTWSAFADALHREHEIGALFAFPVSVGSLRLGAVDLYNEEPMRLDGVAIDRLLVLSGLLGRRVLERAIRLSGDADTGISRHGRRLIHQATGFVIAQLGVSADDASQLIRAHAFAKGQSMEEVAQQILDRTLTFTVSGARIEGDA